MLQQNLKYVFGLPLFLEHLLKYMIIDEHKYIKDSYA